MFEDGGAEAEQGRECSKKESRLSHDVRQCHLANEGALSPLVEVRLGVLLAAI